MNRLRRIVSGAGTVLEIVPSDCSQLPSLRSKIWFRTKAAHLNEFRALLKKLPKSKRIEIAQQIIDGLDRSNPANIRVLKVIRNKVHRSNDRCRLSQTHGS